MTTDLALDFLTGDLVVTPSNDFGLVSGIDAVEQRIRVRLKIHSQTWELDPTDGTLGSHLTELARLPTYRVLEELPLVVKEALAPMDDIRVVDVTTSLNENVPTQVDFVVVYTMVEGEVESEPVTFNGTFVTA